MAAGAGQLVAPRFLWFFEAVRPGWRTGLTPGPAKASI